jgi:hypothetical protein
MRQCILHKRYNFQFQPDSRPHLSLHTKHGSVYKPDVRGSVHRSTILTEKLNKMQQCMDILLFLILNEAYAT